VTASLSLGLQRTVKYCIQIIFLFIFAKGIISIIKSKGQPPQIHLILYQFSLPFFLFILTLIGFKNVYIERSLLVILPFYYLILVKGLTHFKNGSTISASVIAVLLFNVVTLSLFFYKNDEWTVYKPNPDWRAASYYFREELKSTSEPTLVFATSKSTELIYYDDRFREFRESEIQDFAKRKIDKLEQLFGGKNYLFELLSSEINKYITSITKETYGARIIIHYVGKKEDIDKILLDSDKEVLYLVHNKYWPAGFGNLVKDITEDFRFNLLGKQSFQGLEIFKFNVAAAAPQ
jgi:hypothetical protein